MTEWILQSERLLFRRIQEDDVWVLRGILQDIEVMYAWEHAFTDAEVDEWIAENHRRYAADGFSYFAAIEKQSRRFIGVIGPLVETFGDDSAVGVGYILNRAEWNKGYALEAAAACMAYAFRGLHARRVVATIRPENTASCRVAEKLGMKVEGQFIRRYCGKEMPHLLYCKMREQQESKA